MYLALTAASEGAGATTSTTKGEYGLLSEKVGRTVEDLPAMLDHLPDHPSPKFPGSSGDNHPLFPLLSRLLGIEQSAFAHRLGLGE